MAFIDEDRFSVYLGAYADLGAIISHFKNFSVAEIMARDLRLLGFEVIVSVSELLDQPHADVFPPPGKRGKALTKLAQRHVVPSSRLIHIDSEAEAQALSVVAAAKFAR